jgi:hypothetical protein
MPPRKRTKFERESHLEQVTEMYLRGKFQSEIAVALKISQPQVSYDVAIIQKRWRKSSLVNWDKARAKELERIDSLEREYWAAWEASKTERTKTRQETDGTLDKNKKLTVKKASTEKEQRDGNPAFLAGVIACIDRRCKLLGLDAPTKSELTGKDGGPIETKDASITDEDRAARIVAIFDRARARRDSASDGG